MWRGAILLQSLDITEYKSKGRYIISYASTFGLLQLFDSNIIFLHFKQILCKQLLEGCMTKPFQLDNEGSYSSKQQSQNNL